MCLPLHYISDMLVQLGLAGSRTSRGMIFTDVSVINSTQKYQNSNIVCANMESSIIHISKKSSALDSFPFVLVPSFLGNFVNVLDPELILAGLVKTEATM